MQEDFAQEGLSFELTGLDAHRALLEHPLPARR
jgi:hypothetical protein